MRALLVSALLAATIGVQSAGAASITITGPEEVVYDWSTMRCFEEDLVDGTTRALRDALGRVQLNLGGSANTRMIGPDLNNLTHDCTTVLTSNWNPLPWEYDGVRYTGGGWTFDGQEVFRLVHTEVHTNAHPGYCQGVRISCGFNTITFARSTDMGNSYTRPPIPDHLVAAVPYHYVPSEGRVGYFAPSNIIEKDGWYYSLVLASRDYKQQRNGVCVMRTQNVADPKSWRAWDGNGFDTRFVDPYRDSTEPVNRHVCAPVSPEDLGQVHRHVTWNSHIGKFIATGSTTDWNEAEGRTIIGFYYAFSDDLIEWTHRQLLMEVEHYGSWVCGDPDIRAYPALLDPDAPDRNFTITDNQAYLYYMVHRRPNCVWTNDRDLVRVPVQFNP